MLHTLTPVALFERHLTTTESNMARPAIEVQRPKKPAAKTRSAARARHRLFEGAVTGLRAHDLVTRGVTVADALHLMRTFTLIDARRERK